MLSLGLPALGLSLIFSIALCVHAVKTGREMYWLFIILMFQPLGGVVYAIINVLPDVFGGSTARRIKSAAKQAMDPEREYREARQALQDTATVANRMRLAQAAEALGRFSEAEEQFRAAETGIHANDPALLLGRARALLELKRPEEALAQLQRLAREGEARTPQAAMAFGRAYQMLGRNAEAEEQLAYAAGRMPGLEGLARYTAFLAQTGRKDDARAQLAEIDRRVERTPSHFRKEAHAWRDLAAAGLR
jgi:hypothetical protein